MGYKILEGFLLRLSNFSPQNSCLFSSGLNIFCFTSLEVVGPEAFVSLPLGMQVIAQFMMLLVMTLLILSECCEKSILS